jgi:PAS domain S-box-containing protein
VPPRRKSTTGRGAGEAQLIQAAPPKSAPAAETSSRDLINRPGTAFLRWNLKSGAIVDASPSVEGLLGHSPDDFIEDAALTHRATHPDFAKKFPALVAQWSLEKPAHVRFEGQFLASDGREVWLQVSGVPEYSAAGELTALAALVTDISPLVLARRAADEGRSLYMQLFRSGPMPLLLYDPDTLAVVDANAFACAAYGIPHSEFCGMYFDERAADEEKPRAEERLRGAGKPVQVVPRMMHRKGDGSVFPVHVVTVALPHTSRPLRLAVVRDLTETEIAESTVRVMRGALELASAPVLVLDQDGRVVFANAATDALTGRSHEGLQSHALTPVVAPGWEATWNGALSAALRGGTWSGKLELRKRKTMVRVELHPIIAAGAKVSHVVVLLNAPLEPSA